jgi:hypothetical protein
MAGSRRLIAGNWRKVLHGKYLFLLITNYSSFRRAAGYLLGAGVLAVLPVSRLVVRAFTGDFALTARANLITKWLRRAPVRRGVVRFFGLPMR